MTSGIINICVGAVGVFMGLSGSVLVFTNSSEALIIGGGLIACLGLWQVWRSRQRGV